MAPPHNFLFPQDKPDEFFDYTNNDDDTIVLEIKHNELSVDQFI